ncbi:MAG: tetratricopeptide repeat protein [Alphaproteobacteria bacterium]
MALRGRKFSIPLLLTVLACLAPQPAYATGDGIGLFFGILFLFFGTISMLVVYIAVSAGFFAYSRYQPKDKRRIPGAGTRLVLTFFIVIGLCGVARLYYIGDAYVANAQEIHDIIEKADKGDLTAQMDIAFMYSQGIRVGKNTKTALKWYRKAAEQGHEGARYALADIYSNGDGVKKDLKEAARWMRLSAEQGWQPAEEKLAEMYETGLGVPRDLGEAYFWQTLNARSLGAAGSEYQTGLAITKSDELKARLTPRQVESQNRRIMDWKAKPSGLPTKGEGHTFTWTEMTSGLLR